MGMALSEVAKELHLRVDQGEESGIPELTRNGTLELTKGVFDIISLALIAGESISIPKFGKFEAFVKPARKARNPRTGESIDVPEKLSVKFKPSSTLRAQLSEVDVSSVKKTKASTKEKATKAKGKKKGRKKK